MFQRPIVGTILCFVALRLTVAIETEATTTTASLPKNTVGAVTSTREASCSKPPTGVDPTKCCNISAPFPGTVLNSCQKSHVQWLNNQKNSTCGSQCLFNYLVNASALVPDVINSPPEKWLLQMQHLSTYYNAISNCVKFANFEQFLTNLMKQGTSFQDVVCEMDLLETADCISKHWFQNCPVFVKSEQCQAAKAFLNTSCLYSELFV